MDDGPPIDDRERRLIEAVVSLAKTFRDEREQLMRRLVQLEQEMRVLALRLDAYERPRPAAPPDGRPSDPSRTRS